MYVHYGLSKACLNIFKYLMCLLWKYGLCIVYVADDYLNTTKNNLLQNLRLVYIL